MACLKRHIYYQELVRIKVKKEFSGEQNEYNKTEGTPRAAIAIGLILAIPAFEPASAAKAAAGLEQIASVKYKTLRSKSLKLSVKKVLTVKNQEGTLTYKKKSGNAKITIAKSTGRITVKKGLKKGTYKVKVTVSAAGDDFYLPGSKTVTFRIKVK